MLTLYGKAQSRAARCLWVLEETGLPYTHVPTDPTKGEARMPDYLALNPSGKIPTLVDDDFVLTESIAITYYISSLTPTSLYPDHRRTCARIAQWSSWAVAEMEPPVTRLVRARREAAGGPADPTLAASCITDIEVVLSAVERCFADYDHLASNDFTLADINAATAVMVAPLFVDMGSFPRTAAWLARVLARPAWQRVKALP